MTLRNHYGVEMGTSGLIVQAQSREEIMADKIVAFALRPNRLKNRDLWDIGWLKQQNVILPVELVAKKVVDHQCNVGEFLDLIEERNRQLRDEPARRKEFIHEMQRFLPPQVVSGTVENEAFWTYLTNLLQTECVRVMQALTNTLKPVGFKM